MLRDDTLAIRRDQGSILDKMRDCAEDGSGRIPSRPMSYDDMCEIYRVEMTTSPLSQVRGDLYPAMADLCANLGEYKDDLSAASPESVMVEGAEHRMRAAKRIQKEIIRIRADKILRAGFLRAIGQSTR